MNWRRILLLSIALVSVLGIVTWALLQNSDLATEFVRRQLNQTFATRAEIDATTINLQAGRLSITGFELADPDEPERVLVRVPTTNVDVQADLFGTGVQLRHVVLHGPEFECGPTFSSLTKLLKKTSTKETSSAAFEIPVLEIKDGTAKVHLCEGERALSCEDLDLTVVPLASDPSKLQINGELSVIEPVARVKIAGEFDTKTGAATLSVTTEDVACSHEIVAYLSRLAQFPLDDVVVAGHIDSLAVTCSLPPSAAVDPTPTFKVATRCSKVNVDKEGLPAIVRQATLTLFTDTSGPGNVRAKVEQHNDTGDLSITTHLKGFLGDNTPTFDLLANGRNVLVDENSIAALQTFPMGKGLVAALQPTTGRGDIDLYLRDPHAKDGVAEMDLTMRGCAVTFRGFGNEDDRIGFPLPLENASGNVRLRGTTLLLEDVKASIPANAGGGDVTLEGRIEIDQPSGEDTSLDIHGDSVAFTDELATALATLLGDGGDLYRRLKPSGRAKVHVAVRPMSELRGGFFVEVQPLSAAMRWEGFPYRLDDLRGSIRIRMDDARFDLTGRHGDGGLSMRGQIPLHAEHRPEDGFEAVITADQLVLDEDLRAGIARVVPELDARWQNAAPSGRISGEIKVWRPQPDDPLFHDVQLALHNVDLRLPVAPWRATNLVGQVLVQGSGAEARIDFDALRGRLENPKTQPAKLALLGHLEAGKKPVRNLAFVVRDLEVSQELGRSLSELGALDITAWSSLKPSGRVDLVTQSLLDDKGEDQLQVVVQLVDVTSRADMLPKPAEHLTGELHIQGGELTFTDVRGKLGDTTVNCTNGTVRQLPAPDGRTEITFGVHADDFPVDDGLANLFSGPLRQAVRDRKPSGKVNIVGLRLTFQVPTGDSKLPFTTTIGGTLSLEGVDILLGAGREGIKVNNLHGDLTFAPSTVTEAGGKLSGALTRGSLQLFGHAFESVEASFSADDKQLAISRLDTRVADGKLINANENTDALTYLLPAANVPDGRLAADLAYRDIDVFALLTACGWDNPPYSGTAHGTVKLRRLDGNTMVGAAADGSLTIERADLGKVPLFKAIYAQLPAADQPRFNYLDVIFRLTKEAIEFDKLNVRSDILAAEGKGRLHLDGYLDVKMDLDNLLGQSADPLLMPFLEYLAQNLVSFRLYGHLRDLRAGTELIGERMPKRPQVLPMPPARAKPKTPGY